MQTLRVLLLATCLGEIAYANINSGSVLVAPDIQLGLDANGEVTAADIYCGVGISTPCNGKGGSPVVLLLPGATGAKEEYSGIATSVAEAGYTVVVLEQLSDLPPIPSVPGLVSGLNDTNLVTAAAVPAALDWLHAVISDFGTLFPGCSEPRLDTVALLGHSLGAASAKQVLNGFVSGSALGPAVDLPYLPEVRGAYLFGFAEGIPMNDDMLQEAMPVEANQTIFVANGDLDRLVASLPISEDLNENDAYLVLKDIDHFSIADSVFLDRGFDVLSDRSRREQVQLVSSTATAALGAMTCSGSPPGQDVIPEFVEEAFGDDKVLMRWLDWLPAISSV